MRTIAIVNQKGGCGKTTTAINLAAVLARRGERTLLVDMDPQAHCAVGLGVPEDQVEVGVAEALISEPGHLDADGLIWEVARDLDLLPSTVRLAGMEAPGGGLHQLQDRDKRLAMVLGELSGRYDTCLIDCPPTIGLLTFNALRAAREALIPVETGFFALKGAQRQWDTIQRTIRHIGRPIACHLLPTLHRQELDIARSILATMRRTFAGQITPIVIREHETLREAASYGQPVAVYAPGSDAHMDYERLADWLAEHRPDASAHVEIVHRDIDAPRASIPYNEPKASFATEPIADQLGRAAELARRVSQRDEPPRSPARSVEVSASPATATVVAPQPVEPLPEPPQPVTQPIPEHEAPLQVVPTETTESDHQVAHLFGVRPTSQGTLFVQPGNGGRTIAVAGDFNGWSTTANALKYNPQLDLYQAIIPIEPGEHRYRLVIDGVWQADPYNPRQERNQYGEPNSLLAVAPRSRDV